MCIPVSTVPNLSALRSAARDDLVVPRTRLQLGNRAFFVAGPVAREFIYIETSRSEPVTDLNRSYLFVQDRDEFVIQMLNGIGDYLDLRQVLVDPRLRPNFRRMSLDELKQYNVLNGHCSALVKVPSAHPQSLCQWYTYVEFFQNFDRITQIFG